MDLLTLFEAMMRGKLDNLKLLNNDGFDLIKLILNKDALKHFKITINAVPGKTLFEKI